MSAKIVKGNRLILIMLVSLVIIGAVILSNFISFFHIEKVMTDQIVGNQLTRTVHAASQIASHIHQVREELVALSQFPAMATLDINHCSGDMKIIHEDIEGKIDTLLRTDKNGNVIECSSPDYSDFLGLNIKNKDYFRIPEETKQPYIDSLDQQGANQQIIISVPLFETSSYTPYPNFMGNFKGIMFSIIDLNKLFNLYLHPILEEENLFIIKDITNNRTILESRGLPQEINLPEEFISDQIINLKTFGDTIVTSSEVVVDSNTWRLQILTPVKDISEDIKGVQKRHMFSLIFVFIVIAVAFAFLVSLYKSKEEVQKKLIKTQSTLDKLGIKIETEGDKFNQADIQLDLHKVYLIKEDDENTAHELFINCLNTGLAGLGIVREDPNVLRKRYNLEKTSFIWMTKNEAEEIASETDIEKLYGIIYEFVKKSDKSVVMLDRLDYLLRENDFSQVMKKISSLRDLALNNKCTIILSLNTDIVPLEHVKAIEAETIDLYGKDLKKKVSLSEIEMNILIFINERNIVNKLVSYKDITDKFNITKPTTRSKISRLEMLGLLKAEKMGRYKSLKITSAGRRLI